MRRRAGWVGAGLAVVLAAGLVVAWSRAGGSSWPSRLTIRPPAGSWPLGLSADGRSYLLGGDEGATSVDLATGGAVASPAPPRVRLRCRAADGRHYAGVAWGDFIPDGAVVWSDARTHAVERSFPAPNLQVRLLDLVDDGRTIRAVAGLRNNSTVVITWDIATGAEARRPIAGPGPGFSRPLAFAPGGRAWAYLDFKRDAVQVWDGDLDRPLGPPLRTPATRRDLASWAWAAALFLPDGRTVYVGRSDGQVEAWDRVEHRLIREVRLFPAGSTVMNLILAPDGRTVAATGAVLRSPTWAGQVRDHARWRITGESISEATQEAVLLDLATHRVVARAPGSVPTEFTPDSRSVVTLGRDKAISVRDLPRSGAP